VKRLALVAVVALAVLSCDDRIHHDLHLTFDPTGTRVTISASTWLPDAKEAKDRAQVDAVREALVGGRDEWSLRLANAEPKHDRVVFEHDRGQLSYVERSATIDAADLQKFFYDVPVTSSVLRGDGWAELSIYPGASTRATNAQRAEVEKKLDRYSARAVRYFGAVRALYAYLDERPQRADDIILALFRDKDDDPLPPLTKSELDLADDVRHRVDGLLDSEGESTTQIEREADLVFNPFPAKLIVHVPGEPLLVEGFSREMGGGLVAQTPSLLEAIASLEGRWISPDPIAFALQPDRKMGSAQTAALFAQLPRHAAPVVGAGEVAEALTKKMRPAERYRVRFITKASS